MIYTVVYFSNISQTFSRATILYSSHDRAKAWQEAKKIMFDHESLVCLVPGKQEIVNDDVTK